ncbi:MAG: tRNA pseudouridine(38-40) synthase TruA [Bacillota bacterium]|nr:tRNA pseudouridine(38-40) synthase TruA [Bacillota bacterium]
MRTIKLTLAYNGTAYAGYQLQSGRPERTIQGELEKALFKVTGERIRPVAAGRTDAGVHALGQVVSFSTRASLPLQAWVPALNAHLPADVVVRRAEEAAEGFHARFSAVGKVYRYLIQNGRTPAVLWRPFAWWIPVPLEVEAMKEAGRYLEGEHDFSSFRASGFSTKTSVRRLVSLRWRVVPAGEGDLFLPGPAGTAPSAGESEGEGELGRLIAVELTADGFLYQMARIIVGTLVEVGRGRLRPQEVAEILAAKDRRRAGPTAPACGLCLVKVFYEPERPC